MSCPHSSQSPGPQIPHSRAGVDYATGNKPKQVAGYDGKSSWSDYLAQFEIASKMNNWDSQQKAMELATSLVGVGGTDAGSRTGGSDGAARMGESGSVIEVDGSGGLFKNT